MDHIRWSEFAQFSHPGVTADEQFIAAVAEAYANIAIEDILRPELRPCVQNWQLFDNLRHWLDRRKPLDHFWFTSLGKLGAYIRTGEQDGLPDLLGRVCLEIAGQFGDFSAVYSLRSDTPMLFGSCLLNPGDTLSITRVGSELNVGLEGRELGLSRVDMKTGLVATSTVEHLPLIRIEQFKIIQTNQRESELLTGFKYGLPLAWSKLGNFDREQTVTDGIALLQDLAPGFFKWVRRVVHTIIVVPSATDPDCSGSWPDSPGTIYLSEPRTPLKAAEVLVHEASHQYFHMAERISPSILDKPKTIFLFPGRRNGQVARSYFASIPCLRQYIEFLCDSVWKRISQRLDERTHQAAQERCRYSARTAEQTRWVVRARFSDLPAVETGVVGESSRPLTLILTIQQAAVQARSE